MLNKTKLFKLENIKITSKLSGGFGIILVLTLLLGIASWMALGTLRNKADFAMHAGELSRNLLRARQHEKNYMLRGDENYVKQLHETIKKTITKAETLRDTLEGKARLTIETVRKSLVDYDTAFNTYVEQEKNQQEELSNMVVNAQNAEKAAITLRALQKTQLKLLDASGKSNKASRQDKRAKATAANRMIKYVNMMRISEKNFLMRSDDKYIDVTRSVASNLLDMASSLSNKFKDPENRKAVNGVMKATETYIGNFNDMVKVTNLQKEAEGNMVKEANIVKENVVLAQNIAKAAMESGQSTATNIIIAVVLFVIGFGSFAARLISRGITVPVNALTTVMNVLAEGNTEVDVPGQERGDEIGTMAKAVEVFKSNAIENKRLEKENQEAEEARSKAENLRLQREKEAEEEKVLQEKHAREERRKATLDMADKFEDSVSSLLIAVTEASKKLSDTSSQMTIAVDDTRDLSLTASSASEQAGSNVQTVAAASEEMTVAIAEIARRVNSAAELAKSAVERTQDARERVTSLTEKSDRIGDMVGTINDIAEQTNLLALNATIEAARAGDAGKGFAVVASEVKSLASQTAGATDEITIHVKSIQDASQMAVEAVASIATAIEEVNGIASEIAASTEEQNAATNEISRNAAEAALGTTEANTNVLKVSERAKETGISAAEVKKSADHLSVQANDLQTAVDNFLGQIRAG